MTHRNRELSLNQKLHVIYAISLVNGLTLCVGEVDVPMRFQNQVDQDTKWPCDSMERCILWFMRTQMFIMITGIST